jgi:hypothetical protein
VPVPASELVAWNLAITAALAVALPLARRRAGRRLGESAESLGRATARTALGMAAWLALTGGLAYAGVLSHWERMPPPILWLLAASVALVIALALGSFGRTLASGLPLWALVGYQAFRVVVEVMLHRAYEQGVIGVQMTWSGRNLDVVTGLSALFLGAWLWRRGEKRPAPRAVLWIWNVMGLGLLANIVTVAILSMPTRLRAFDGPPNSFVAEFPFVWLPTVMVTAALFGHLLLARRLVSESRGLEHVMPVGHAGGGNRTALRTP